MTGGEYLGEDDLNKIAQWIEALSFEKEVLGLPGGIASLSPFIKSTYLAEAWGHITSIGYVEQAQGNVAAYEDILSLRYLIGKGKLSGSSADAFLRTKYKDQKWTGGKWKKKASDLAASKANDKALAVQKNGKQPKPADLAFDASGGVDQRARAPFQGVGGFGSTSMPPVLVDQLPDEYSSESTQALMQSVVNQVMATMGSVANGRLLALAPGSLSGAVLAPGSVQSTSLAPLAVGKDLIQVPGPDQAVLLNVSRSTEIDQWATDGTTRGPGRVWRVNTFNRLKAFKPTAGATRYRLPLKEMQFGVMSLLMRTDSWSGAGYIDNIETRYGVILHGIPNRLGRHPINLRLIQFGEDAPSQMRYKFKDGGIATDPPWRGSKNIVETRAQTLFQTSFKPGWAASDLTSPDSVLSASTAMLETITGVSVMLITATTTEGVWQQLNTREPHAGAAILGAAHGPMLSAPTGLEASPPCPPSAIEWDGDATVNAQYDHLGPLTAISSATRLVQGAPISMDDCSKLRAQESEFSLVIQVIGHETSPVSGTWPKPAHWFKYGLKAVANQLRDWTLDVVVE